MLGLGGALAAIMLVGIAFGTSAGLPGICSLRPAFAPAYWIWAGITEHDIADSTNAVFYVYQGDIRGPDAYSRKGIFPYPMKGHDIYIVFRTGRDLPALPSLVALYTGIAADWRRHGVRVRGLQLDADYPTAGLAQYARFLRELRAVLPKDAALSITGLGDWIVSGIPEDLRHLASAVDEVVFQLYQERDILNNADDFLVRLRRVNYPFKIGWLAHKELRPKVADLYDNCRFRGVIFFVQK